MDHHALQGRAHAQLHHTTTALVRRVAGEERGQGSVEYVALILLVGGVLAAAVTAAGGTEFDLAGKITSKMGNAISSIGGH